MAHPRTFVLTGATSGLGLELARALVRDPRVRLIVGARSPDAPALRSAVPADRLRVEPLDLADLASVRRFAAAVDGPVAGIACNAGMQAAGAKQTTPDGLERTFAANHLGHFLLVHLLLPQLMPGAPVVSTASGTHDPDDPMARRFGFRGGQFSSAEAVAAGEFGSASEPQANRDRYATSKLCNILFTREMAQRVPPAVARFAAFDPGLMPGTGLAREHPAPVRVVWRRAMPLLRHIVDGVSTPARSAGTLADMLAAPERWRTGSLLSFTGETIEPAAIARRDDHAAALYALSARLAGVETIGAGLPSVA